MGTPEASSSPAQWKDYYSRQAVLAQFYALSYAVLGQWEQAEGALLECRSLQGAQWDGDRFLYLLHMKSLKSAPSDEELSRPNIDTSNIPKPFLALVKAKAEPDKALPPAVPPIRMLLWGNPAWASAWKALSKSKALAPWGPGEIAWAVPGAEDQALVARAKGVALEAPCWAAIQGDAVLASGAALPDERFLAFQLSQAGQTRLQRLSAFIRQNPMHREARFDRYELLRKRLPNALLEPLVAEDAAKAWLRLEWDAKEAWKPDQQLWEQQAAKLMPELEAALRRWPSDAALWKTWASWLPFRAKSLSPCLFAQSLDVLRPKGEWLAGLPEEVHLALATEWREQKKYGEMLHWFQTAWEGCAQREDCAAKGTIRRCLEEARKAAGQI